LFQKGIYNFTAIGGHGNLTCPAPRDAGSAQLVSWARAPLSTRSLAPSTRDWL